MKTKNVFVIISSLFVSNLAIALPSGGSVAAGSATISQTNTQTTINQSSQNAVINWNGFDTSSNQSVVFNQPNSTSNTLNRINSGLPTNFAGSLTANGNVFIVNSSGIVFAKGSKVDVAGLIATTLDINNNDFMNANYTFTLPQGSGSSSIINNGTLTAEDKGVIALIAPNVQNGDSGIIQANCGTVNLSTGKTFVVDFNGDNLINFDASSTINNGAIKASGKISANGGKILMTNNAVSQTLDDVINVSGVLEASTAKTGQNGEIILEGGQGAISETDAGTMIASGASSFSTEGQYGDITLTNNQFSGPVSFRSGRDVSIGDNHGLNLIFADSVIAGNLMIMDAESNISQTSMGSLIVDGMSIIQTNSTSSINLANSGNQFKGQVNVSNVDGPSSNCSVTLNNSIATEIGVAAAEGVLTITSGGQLTIDTWVDSYATSAPNGHSIILAATRVLFTSDADSFDPGKNNSWLIYVPNPTAIVDPSNPIYGSGKPGQIWNQSYTPSSPATISVGNHFVYASSQTA
jgi:filamentous hemagglutinin family protein